MYEYYGIDGFESDGDDSENINDFFFPEESTPPTQRQASQSPTDEPEHHHNSNTSVSGSRTADQTRALTPSNSAQHAEDRQVSLPRSTVAMKHDSPRKRRLSEAKEYSTGLTTARKRIRQQHTGFLERGEDGQARPASQPRAGTHGFMGPEQEQLHRSPNARGEAVGATLHNEKTIAGRVKIWFFRFLGLRHDETMNFMRTWDSTATFETVHYRQHAYQHASRLNNAMFGTQKLSNFVAEKVKDHDSGLSEGRPEYDTLSMKQQRDYWVRIDKRDEYVLEMFEPLGTSVDIHAAYLDPVWKKYMVLVFAATCVFTWKHRPKWEAEHVSNTTKKENIKKKQIYEEIRQIPLQENLGLPAMSEVPVLSGGPASRRRRDNLTAIVDEDFVNVDI